MNLVRHGVGVLFLLLRDLVVVALRRLHCFLVVRNRLVVGKPALERVLELLLRDCVRVLLLFLLVHLGDLYTVSG